MNAGREVTAEAFAGFLLAHPRPLVADVLTITEPSQLQYNDFAGGKVWPESVIAYVVRESEWRGFAGVPYDAPDRYFIKESR